MSDTKFKSVSSLEIHIYQTSTGTAPWAPKGGMTTNVPCMWATVRAGNKQTFYRLGETSITQAKRRLMDSLGFKDECYSLESEALRNEGSLR